MPAGCEFICRNQSCKHHGCGFTITSPWPMGRIELVLNAPNIKKVTDLRQQLIDFKNEGRKYACITYPNVSRIKTEAYRVHMWSNDAKCLWQYDAVIDDPSESLEQTISNANIPLKCPNTDGDLWDFNTTIKNGIFCPHCNIPMQQDRWFTNEE